MSGPALESDADRAATDVLAGRPVRRIAAAEGKRAAFQPIEVELITYHDVYTPPQARETFRVGDVAASSILMNIVESGTGAVQFQWFNFSRGEPQVGTWQEWSLRKGFSVFNSRVFVAIGSQLTPSQWRSLWPDPRAEVLRLYEARQLSIPSGALLELYRGSIHSEAERLLDENESAVDQILNAPDRVQFFQEYADGLREASEVRDTLERKEADVERSMVQMQGFSFGMAGRVVNMNPVHRLQMSQRLVSVQQALAFWRRAFPLLTRMRTADINPASVLANLQSIKASIISTRARLVIAPQGRGGIDLWELDQVRARIDARLGPRATQVVADESASRRRWAWARAGLMLAGGIALLFVPGGVFIDLAIGVAMGVAAWDKARVLGDAANTGIHVDDALLSQGAADAATFEAVLATVFAALGAAAAGLRVLRLGRVFLNVRRAAPTLELSAQVRVARVLSANPRWLRAGADIADIDRAIAALGSRMRFEEMQLLRRLVYGVHGRELPTHSRESLEEFLGIVWRRRSELAAEASPENAVYRVYSGATEPNALSRSGGDS